MSLGWKAMCKARFKEYQITVVQKPVEAGRTVWDVCREVGISEASYYNLKATMAGWKPLILKILKT